MKSHKDLELQLHMAKRFKELRTMAGISQEDAAFSIGLTRVSIANIESGEHGFTVMVLLKAAKFFNISPLELLPSEKDFDVPIRSRTEFLKTRTEKRIASLEDKLRSLKELQNQVIKPI